MHDVSILHSILRARNSEGEKEEKTESYKNSSMKYERKERGHYEG